jgi:hypothetical protein
VVASAAAACWSPRAAAACVRDKLIAPPFAAKAEPGSSAAIKMHNTKRMRAKLDSERSPLFHLLHRFASEPLAVRRLRVAHNLFQAGVAGDGCNLMRCASSFR